MTEIYNSNSLIKCAIDLKRKNFNAILEYADSIENDSPLFIKTQIYAYRALSEQGKLVQAQELLDKLVSVLPDSSPDYYIVQMYKGFHHPFISESIAFEDTLQKLEEWGSNDLDIETKALTCVLKSKTINVAIALGNFSVLRQVEAAALLELAAGIYLQAGNIIEYAATIRSLATILQQIPFSDYTNALQKLELLATLPGYPDPIFFEGIVKLEIANIKFKQTNMPGKIPDAVKMDEVYNEAFHLLKQAEYEYAEGDVYFEYGRLLLEYGYPVGVDFLHKAITSYSKKEEIQNRQAAWKKIADWHRRHGYDKDAQEADRESSLLDQQIQLKMVTAIQAMMEIHTAFVEKREGLAIQLGEKYLAAHNNSRMAPQIRALLANSLAQSKRKNLAKDHFLQVIAYYEPSSPSTFLSEAYFNYGNFIFLDDMVTGTKAMQKAIEIADTIGDHISTGRFARELAVNMTNYYALQGSISLEQLDLISGMFDLAFESLKRSSTFISGVEQINTLEKRGLLYSSVKDHSKSFSSFLQAEARCIDLGLKTNLAFLQGYMGLSLLQRARDEGNPSLYQEASLRFSLSSMLYTTNNAYRFAWRNKYLQAQTFKELAMATTDTSVQTAYWIDAESTFNEAAKMVDYLKGLTSKEEESLVEQAYQAYHDYPKDFGQVFIAAMDMNLRLRKNPSLAWLWAEKNKSRLLQKELAKGNEVLKKMGLDNLPDYQNIRTLLFQQELLNLEGRKIIICEYFILEDQIILFLIKSEWYEPKVFVLPKSSAQLFKTVNYLFFQGTENLLENLNDGLEAEWTDCSFLIQNVLLSSQPGDVLYFIPHSYLHQLPFHSLKDDQGAYLIERNPVVYSPSAAVLFQVFANELHGNKLHSQYDFAVFGNSRNDLTYSQSEAESIGPLVKAHPVIGDKVTKWMLIEAITKAKLVHFAGHASSNVNDGLQQHLLLAGDETFTALELMKCINDLDMLVLSGCETGTSEVRQSVDELVGLPTAALLSGTKSVLSTLWKVNDESTQQFFIYFYKAYAEQRQVKILALQSAMVEMINDQRFSFFHWAPFLLTGKHI